MRQAFISAVIAVVCLAATNLPVMAEPVKVVTFPQEHSDFKPDPQIKYGRLANGMTYILRHNVSPPKVTNIYLRIAAGSAMETPQQLGLAHFVEHMAFEGSSHVPTGELRNILERHGFAFGPDINAFTSTGDTIYQLKAPQSDPESLDTSLFLLHEIAENLTLSQSDVERERGVILSELRLRDTPQLRASVKLAGALGFGLRTFDRLNVGGSADIVSSANAPDLKRFYDAWYRPELATLILVGDFDVDVMEARVRNEFGSWKGREPLPDEPDWGKYTPGGIRTLDYSDTGLPETLTLSWISAAEKDTDTQGRETAIRQDNFLSIFFNKRLQERALSPDTSLLGGRLTIASTPHGIREVRLTITPRLGKARAAFDEALSMLGTFRSGGLSPAENDQFQTVIPQIEHQLIVEDRTATSDARAASYIGSLRSGIVVKAPAVAVATLETARSAVVSPAEIGARLESWFEGDGPVLTHMGPTPFDFDGKAMQAEYERVSTQTSVAYNDSEHKAWPYSINPTPVEPAEHTTDPDFGYSRYVWPNGLVLKFKQTRYTASQILIDVAFPGGKAMFGPRPAVSPALAQASLVREGGLGKISYPDLQRTFQRFYWNINYSMADTTTHLSGEARLGELPIELQVLMAYATDPALDKNAFNRFRAAAPGAMAQIAATPTGTFGMASSHLLYNDDPRFDNSVLSHLETVDYGAVQAMIRQSLSSGPMTITIVGDVPEANVVKAIGKTFAALPIRPIYMPLPVGWDHVDLSLRSHDVILYHQGTTNENLDVMRWTTPDCHEIRTVRGLNIAAAIIRNRLYNTLREKDGADYSPTASADCDYTYKNDGHFLIQSTVRTGDDLAFRKTVTSILKDLADHPPSEDEFARAVKPVLVSLEPGTNSNAYWEDLISSIDIWPGYRANMLSRRSDFEAITPSEISLLVKKWLRDDNLIHIQLVASVTH